MLLPRLYAIVDVETAGRFGWTPRELARAYLAGGARFLQLRAKSAESGAFLELASAIVEDATSAGASLVVNDRADVAAIAGAAGVHVGQEDLSPSQVRRIVGADAVLGLSTHTELQIRKALSEPISYLAVGPVYSTSTKATGYSQVGLALVSTAAREAGVRGVPLVAIGGITLATAPRVLDAGASAVAIITDLLADDPESRVRQYLSAIR